MAKKPNKTEQGRQKRAAEKAARAAATQGRRDSAAAAQKRSEQRKGQNVDEGSESRDASFAAREANAGLYLAGNDTISASRGGSGPSFADREAANGLTNTTSGGVASNAADPDFPPVGTPLGNDEFVTANNTAFGVDEPLYAFKILKSTTVASNVVVARGSVQSSNGDPVFPPQTNVDPQSGSKFNFGSTIYLNVTLSGGTVTSAAVSTSAGTVSETKAVIVIGSVSSGGVITQFIKTGLIIYSCGDNQFFQGIFFYPNF
jgi:hypothetical protein